jgi:hypothetical protein
MSQVAPAQYLADTVVVLSDERTGRPALAVVVEPQGRDRRTKRVSWPVYLTTAIKANKVPRAVLVVICRDPAEAERCRRVIRTGHPGFDLHPIVVDPRTFPSWEGAGPYLATLAGATRAIDLGTPGGREAVLAGRLKLTTDRRCETSRTTCVPDGKCRTCRRCRSQ